MSAPEYASLLLIVLPVFKTVAESQIEDVDGKLAVSTDSTNFWEFFRYEVSMLYINLRTCREQPAETFEGFIGTLEKVVEVLDDLVSDSIEKSVHNNGQHRTYTGLQVLRAEIDNRRPPDYGRLVKFVEFSSRMDKREKMLKKLKKYNKKLERLFDSIAATEPAPRAQTRKAPSRDISRLAHTLHQTLTRHLCCNCGDGHTTKLRLAAHRTKNPGPNVDFDVLVSIPNQPTVWQEGRFSVSTQESSTHVQVRFADEPATNYAACRSVCPGICSVFTTHYHDRARPHLQVESDQLWQLTPLMNQLYVPNKPHVSLGTLLRESVTLSRKDRRVLAVILANSLFQLYDSPWLSKKWSKEDIYFYCRATSPGILDLSQPYLTTIFDKPRIAEAEDSQIKHGIHQYPNILALGILLLELELGKPIESQQHDEDLTNGEKNPNTDLTTALRLLEQHRDDVYEDYRAAIQACLDCSFLPLNTNTRDPQFACSIYENIVEKLENELQFAFQIKVESLDNVYTAGVDYRAAFSVVQQVHEQVLHAKQEQIIHMTQEDVIYEKRQHAMVVTKALNTKKKKTHTQASYHKHCARPLVTAHDFTLFDDVLSTLPSSSSSDLTDKWFDLLEENTLLEDLPRTESPIKIAILDTGVDSSDPFISANSDRILACRSFLPAINGKHAAHGNSATHDLFGHGTHVAALVLKVAPYAHLYIARIAPSSRLDDPQCIADAIGWATYECRVDIITMSFGFPERVDVIHRSIKDAYHENVILVAAASNGAGNGEVAYPANQQEVICINSTDGGGNGSRFNPTPVAKGDNFSIVGELVDSSWPGHLQQGLTQRKSGTSFATPVAAGIAALLLDYAGHRLGAEDGNVVSRLRSCAGMRKMFNFMAEERDGYNYIRPWNLLGAGKTEAWICESIMHELRSL